MGWQEDLAKYPLSQEEAEIRARQQAILRQQAQSMGQYATTGQLSITGGGAIGIGSSTNMYANTAGATWLGESEKRRIRHDAIMQERNEIVNMVKDMAEEIGAPTLLHAITLAISLRNEPEE